MISGGVLVANGARTPSSGTTTSSSTGTAAVTINSGGTLAGIGGTGDVTVNGTITAGSGATASDTSGTLYTGAQAWNSGGTYVAKISSTGTNSSDHLVMSGVTLPSSSVFNVQLTGNGATSYTNGQSWVIANVTTGTSSTFSSTALAKLNLTTSNTGSATASHFSFSEQSDTLGNGGEDLVVTYSITATPEPTSALLFAAVASPILLSRRRQLREADVRPMAN